MCSYICLDSYILEITLDLMLASHKYLSPFLLPSSLKPKPKQKEPGISSLGCGCRDLEGKCRSSAGTR